MPSTNAGLPTSVRNVDMTTLPIDARLQLNLNTQSRLCDIHVDTLMHYLKGYNFYKCHFLQLGLVNGFLLHYKGPDIFSSHKNHKSADEQPDIVDSKLAKELHLNRIEGPFLHPPFQNFNISPIGLVPKKEPNSFRLIHDLSCQHGNGLNAYVPKSFSTVHYEAIDTVLEIINKIGPGTLIAKADVESAFRILPISALHYNK
jgi:hypothetical protein